MKIGGIFLGLLDFVFEKYSEKICHPDTPHRIFRFLFSSSLTLCQLCDFVFTIKVSLSVKIASLHGNFDIKSRMTSSKCQENFRSTSPAQWYFLQNFLLIITSGVVSELCKERGV